MFMLRDLKILLKSLLILGICIVVGYLLLILVYMLPTGNIRTNIKNCIEQYETFQTFPEWARGYQFTATDDYTDATYILPNAVYPGEGDEKNPFKNAALVPHIDYVGVIHDIVYELSDNFRSEEIDSFPFCYTRYWHGYLVILKPLLCIFSLNIVRMMNAGLEFILMALILMLAVKKSGNMKLALSLMVSFMLLNPISCAINFQLAAVMNIILVAIMILMLWGEKITPEKGAPFFFLAIGIAVAYFDFLTYPLASLILPLSVYLWLHHTEICGAEGDNSSKFWQGPVFLIRSGFFWAFGYGAFWLSKWVLATVVSAITGANEYPLKDAMKEVGYRSGLSGEGYPYPMVILKNIMVLANWPVIILILTVIAALIVYGIKNKGRGRKTIPAYVCIMIVPFLWCAVTLEHSYDHAVFAFRNMASAILPFMLLGLRD